MKNLILFALIFNSLYFIAHSQSTRDTLSMQLSEIAKNSELPGFSVAMITKDSVLYSEGFGYANVEDSIPFSDETIMNIGSITKTLIGISLMKLVEEGKIALDDDINRYLPFKVTNPHFPNTKITVRQLATHTSSLTDGEDDMLIERTYLFRGSVDFKEEELPEDYFPYFQIYGTNKAMEMGVFLKEIYAEEGELYSKDNYLKSKPGTAYNYTNLGATLLAYIIEQITNISFAEYTKQTILSPLGMQNSYWRLDDIPSDKMAAHYMSNGLLIPNYELITYPDGGLFTNVSDFCLYMMDMIRGLNGEGKLLSQTSYKELMKNQLNNENFPNVSFETTKGIMWSVNRDEDNITMNGADPGVVTYTLFTTQGNLGIIFFTNKSFYGNESLEPDFRKVRATLFQSFSKLLKK